MIKKSLAAVALAVMLVFIDSQGNVAEAERIYIGEFDSYTPLKGAGYLDSYSVRGNPNLILCTVYVSTEYGQAVVEYVFRQRIGGSWTVQYTVIGRSGGGTSIVQYGLTAFEKKLLNYIMDNFE